MIFSVMSNSKETDLLKAHLQGVDFGIITRDP